MSATVAIVSRGIDMSVVLTSLLTQDEPMALHCVLGRLPNERDGLLLDALRHLGWEVSLSLVRAPGIGQARFEVGEYVQTEIVISLDDDAVLKPSDALQKLAAAAYRNAFACPIVRLVHCFHESGITGHVENWEIVSEDDPIIQRALAINGEGWRRVYDFGVDQPTSDLGGTAFACRTKHYRRAVEGLDSWRGGGEDHYIGKRLCQDRPGIALSGVHAYNVGALNGGGWDFGMVGIKLLREEPDRFRRYVNELAQ